MPMPNNVTENFYKVESATLVERIRSKQARRNEVYDDFLALDKKMTKSDVDRLKAYVQFTLQEEAMIADRIYGKPKNEESDKTPDLNL